MKLVEILPQLRRDDCSRWGSLAVLTAWCLWAPVSAGQTSDPHAPYNSVSAVASANSGLGIPLVVQELLPADDTGSNDVVGSNRVKEPVTSGIPLKDSDGIKEVSGLAIRNQATGQLVPAQFRVLKRYPSGNVQWVLVDVQADVPANGTNTNLSVVSGPGPAPGPALARDIGPSISVDTGAARFSVRKTRQNFLDAAAIGGVALITGGHAGGILFQDGAGVIYGSANDAASTAVIEENGDLRTVVKEQGRLVAVDGAVSLGYTNRLTFYRGKPYVKVQVSIENAFRDSLTRKVLKNVEVRLPLALDTTSESALFATKTGIVRNPLKAADTAYLYQADTTHKRDSLAVAVHGYTSFFREENDFGAVFTAAQLDIAAPPYDVLQNSLYPESIIGKQLVLSVDGGLDQTITFQQSDFPKYPSKLRGADVAEAIRARTSGVSSSLVGITTTKSGFLRMSSIGSTGLTSIVIRDGTANAILGVAAGARADGQNGFTIRQGGTPVYDFQSISDYTRGFGELSDNSGKGVAVAMRDFDSFFPSSLEFDGTGEMAVGIFSKYNAKVGLTMDWGVHETRDMLLDFHVTTSDPELTSYRIQYPLFARAPYPQYRDTGVFLGRTHLVSFDELVTYHSQNVLNGVNQFAIANQPEFGVSQYTLPNQQIVRTRSYEWGVGGRQTNNDQTVPKLLSFLSTGKGGLYQTAYNFIHFVVDQAVHHSDREDRTTWPVELEHTVTGPKESLVDGGSDSSKFEEDMEHMNVLGMPMLYYLTGDGAITDALLDHGEWFVREHPFTPRCTPGARQIWQRARWHSLLWEMFGDERFKDQIDKLVNNYLCATIANPAVDPPDPADVGQDQDRGFMWVTESGLPRMLAAGIERFDGLYQLWRVLPNSDVRREELADRIVGYAYFTAQEYYFDRNGSVCNAFGPPPKGSSYNLDQAPPPDSTRQRSNMFDNTLAMAFAYQYTKDPLFLNVGRRTVGAMGTYEVPVCSGEGAGKVASSRQGYAVYAGFGAQDFIYTDLHQDEFGVQFLTELSGLDVTNNRNGSYTLHWTVPVGATHYQIKYGPQPMVMSLKFVKDTRKYQYDPAVYDNFWAGNGEGVTNQPHNVPDEPQPGIAGTGQSYTVLGLDSSRTYHFAMRVETTGKRSN